MHEAQLDSIFLSVLILSVVVFWLFLCLMVGAWSRKRGGSFIAGVGFAVLLSPLLAALIIALREPREKKPIRIGQKRCPYCAEIIKGEAVKCRYCGSDLVKGGLFDYGVSQRGK